MTVHWKKTPPILQSSSCKKSSVDHQEIADQRGCRQKDSLYTSNIQWLLDERHIDFKLKENLKDTLHRQVPTMNVSPFTDEIDHARPP